MSSYGAAKLLADALDEVAETLTHAADVLRDVEAEREPDDEDRKRELARERMRRYRARRPRNSDAPPRNSDANSDAAESGNSDLDGPPLRPDRPKEVGRRNDPTAETRVTSDANRDARNAGDLGPPLTRAERDAAQARIREIGDQLRARKLDERPSS